MYFDDQFLMVSAVKTVGKAYWVWVRAMPVGADGSITGAGAEIEVAVENTPEVEIVPGQRVELVEPYLRASEILTRRRDPVLRFHALGVRPVGQIAN
ncbi:hypothetical protein [Actinopolyspora mortivallis]|uniref:hypothetical protein n=1 Tax=Actinopolyspora mortivallis TaxID=33906 RepID=UPI0011B1CFE5|nr:hypothetical protein [Actinopolyspora mortivallis]